MNVAFEEILERARTLPNAEKKELAHILISDLREDWDEDIQAAWLEEAKRRWEMYQKGEMEAFDGDEVMARLRSRFA